MASPMEDPQREQQGVRFSSQNQEISPEQSERGLERVETITGNRDDLNPEAEQELQQLRTTLKNNMQSARMQHHAFEPISLPGSEPASRVASGTATPNRKSMFVDSSEQLPRASPTTTTVHSPPLTPAATKSRDHKTATTGVPGHVRPTPDVMTPQRSASPQQEGKQAGAAAQASSESIGAIPSHPKQPPQFSIGPTGDSEPPSKETSPSGTPASTAPGTPRPFTPSDAASEPGSKTKKQSQLQRVTSAAAPYRFGNRDPAQGYSSSGQSNVSLPGATTPTAVASGVGLNQLDSKRSSFFGGGKKDHDEHKTHEKESFGSKSNLKRFFKIGEHKHHKEKEREKSHHTNDSSHDGAKPHPNHQDSMPSVPFADDHGLQSKYGKFGKMLGSGAGGSVRLMKRTGDGVVFAVKQFRDRHSYESEKEYNKKVTAEFCIGSTLHHGNIIETIDIVHEKGKWYEVMEYAPYDLFATVMTGKMGRDEVTCATMQILSGVLYLHSMGLAHRDLKLDNVVINDRGIMKLIDFGSAVVFRYPFENDIVLSTGIVGSDPYLAPEVYDNAKYDPRMADIWSIAIIFCCMTLRRFPWKAPRMSDNSYRLFVSHPDPDQEKLLEAHRRSTTPNSNRNSVVGTDENRKGHSEPASRNASGVTDDFNDASAENHKHRQRNQPEDDDKTHSDPVSRQSTAEPATIKGPLRLLRLLPRETRHIIGRMLELDPAERADMDEILADPWVRNSLVCRQEEDNVVIKAPNHTHTLQPSNAGK